MGMCTPLLQHYRQQPNPDGDYKRQQQIN